MLWPLARVSKELLPSPGLRPGAPPLVLTVPKSNLCTAVVQQMLRTRHGPPQEGLGQASNSCGNSLHTRKRAKTHVCRRKMTRRAKFFQSRGMRFVSTAGSEAPAWPHWPLSQRGWCLWQPYNAERSLLACS